MWPTPKRRRSLDARESPILKNVTNVTPKIPKCDSGSSGEWLCSREKPVKKEELSPFLGGRFDVKSVPKVKKSTSSAESFTVQLDSSSDKSIKAGPAALLVKKVGYSSPSSVERVSSRKCSVPSAPVIKRSSSSSDRLPPHNLDNLANEVTVKQEPEIDSKYKHKSYIFSTLGSPLVSIKASPQLVKWSPKFISRKRSLNSESQIFDECRVKIETPEPGSPPKPKWKNSPMSTPKSVRRSANSYFTPPPRRVKDSPASSVSSPIARIPISLPNWRPSPVRDSRLVKLDEDPNIDRREFQDLFVLEYSQSQAGSSFPRRTVCEGLRNLIETDVENSQISSQRYEIHCTQGILNDTCGISRDLVICNEDVVLPQTSRSVAPTYLRKNNSVRAGKLSTFLGSIRADKLFAKRNPNIGAEDVNIIRTQRCWGVTMAVLDNGQQLVSRSLRLQVSGFLKSRDNADDSSRMPADPLLFNVDREGISLVGSAGLDSAPLPLSSAFISSAAAAHRENNSPALTVLALALPLRHFDYSSFVTSQSPDCSSIYSCIFDPLVLNR